jgi:hypothetical protein
MCVASPRGSRSIEMRIGNGRLETLHRQPPARLELGELHHVLRPAAKRPDDRAAA